MPRLTYVGPFRDGVEIPALAISAARGVSFDVADEGNALALLAQPANFLHADDPRALEVQAEVGAVEEPAVAGDDESAAAGEED